MEECGHDRCSRPIHGHCSPRVVTSSRIRWLEDYAVHVIPFYKIDANWSAFLVVADTSFQDLSYKGSDIYLTVL